MRIIAGKWHGTTLQAPPGTNTRPITDRVKEALFNILGHRLGLPGGLPDLAVLDLFAGSGALGLESLSRGARSCLFVERDRQSLRVLRANCRKLKLLRAARIVSENAWTMRIPPARPGGYGLIFVDPPYRDAADPLRVSDLLERLAPRLTVDGVVVFRHAAGTEFPSEPAPGLRCVDKRAYGKMRIVLLQRAELNGQVIAEDNK